MPTLTGTGRIADDLYLLAHDDVTGKPYLRSRALGVGLAGALLAELMFSQAIWIQANHVELTWQRPDDTLSRHVLSLLQAERDWHPIRDWLAFLGLTAEEGVARRLGRAGYLAEVNSRLPWRKHRWVPADSDCAFAAPLLRVKAVMGPDHPATVSDVVLSGLALACGLDNHVLQYGPPDAEHHVDAAVRKLRHGLREVIAETQAAVDSALLSHRV